MEAHALRQRGWTISAIARHLGRDRKTVRDHLTGKREPGTRRRTEPDPLEPFVPYLAARFADGAHVWASALFDEVKENWSMEEAITPRERPERGSVPSST